ncbi:MAG: hydrogenase maturation protease [Bacillota bacterium]
METIAYKVTVIGIGNQLLGDDGLGTEVIKQLQLEEWSAAVLFLDGGTYPAYYLQELSRSQYLIVVDAMKGGAKSRDNLSTRFSHYSCCKKNYSNYSQLFFAADNCLGP